MAIIFFFPKWHEEVGYDKLSHFLCVPNLISIITDHAKYGCSDQVNRATIKYLYGYIFLSSLHAQETKGNFCSAS